MNSRKDILDLIIAHPSNKAMLQFLSFSSNEYLELKALEDAPQFSGLLIFDHSVPSTTKFVLNQTGILVSVKSGEIFAFQLGYNEFVFRCHWEKNDVPEEKRLQYGYFENADQLYRVDARALGSEWALNIHFPGEMDEQLMWSLEYIEGEGVK